VLGHIDEVRSVLGALLGQRRGGRQPAGIAPHNLHELDRAASAHGRRIISRIPDGGGHETRRAPVAGTVVRLRQVVVHCLRDPNGMQLIAPAGSQHMDLVRCIH